MCANRTSTLEIWYGSALSQIESIAPDGDDRQRGLESVATWMRSVPNNGLKQGVEAAVDNAVEGGKLTEEEAKLLLGALPVG
jgi:hypothetical protein